VQTLGWTAIFFAIEKNNLEIIDILIKGGARLDIKDNVRHWSLSLSHSFSLSLHIYYIVSSEWLDSI
jgi:hypothetical protein